MYLDKNSKYKKWIKKKELLSLLILERCCDKITNEKCHTVQKTKRNAYKKCNFEM